MSILESLRKHALFTLTIVGVVIGVLLGFLFRTQSYAENSLALRLINFPGEVFLRGIKFIIIPLVSTSLILGVGGNSVAKTGAIARRTLVFFFLTTLLAVLLAIALVIIIQPGRLNRGRIELEESKNITIASLPSTVSKEDTTVPKLSTWDTFMDVVRNLIPDNIVEMCFYIYRSKLDVNYTTTLNQNETFIEYKVIAGYHRGVNILGLALFSITVGIILSGMRQRGRPMMQFIEIVNEISIRLITMFMWYSPIGVCSLVSIAIIQMQDPVNIFIRLLFYFLTMFFGYAIHGLIVLPTLMYLITRKNVLVFIEEMAEVFLISFATASSSATLPTTIRCAEENARLPKIVSRVVLPCGIIVNKDGTAFYYVVASTFLAQLNLIELGFIDFVINATIALVVSCGGSGTPGAHMANTVLLLSLLHIPVDQISLLIAIDWIIDRFMTVINCWSDCVVCAIVAHLSRKEIADADAKEERVEEEGENDVFVDEPK